jgi:hypothetical protein
VAGQHLQNVLQLELLEQEEMWKLYHMETEPYKKAKILVRLQPYLSSYYEASTMIMGQ